MQIQIKKLHPDAKLPNYAHSTDAGMDMFTAEDFVIEPGEFLQVHTGVAIVFPTGYAGLIWDKGSVSHVRNLKSMGGVFDADYRGEYILGFVNVGKLAQEFKTGDKIAQLIIQKVEHPEIVEVDELNDTERGEGRFGSTGK